MFIAVGTPSRRGDGHADLSYVFAAAEAIGRALTGPAVVVTKSTVPVGTGHRVGEILRGIRPKGGVEVAANPEFLREGSAIGDFMRPDRVVIGADSEHARAVLRQLYRPLYLIETPILFTDIVTAELIKYAANAFLATKITFINEIADLCERPSAATSRTSPAASGSTAASAASFCMPGRVLAARAFPRTARALVRTAGETGGGLAIVATVLQVNEARKRRMADKIATACGGNLAGQRLAVLGLTFKPNTDDMRDAASLEILPRLVAAGACIHAFDPEGMDEAKKLMPELVYCRDAYQTMAGADALVLLTEWNEFRGLDLDRVRDLLARPLVIDLRNIYQPHEMEAAGLCYHSIGRPAQPVPRELRGLV